MVEGFDVGLECLWGIKRNQTQGSRVRMSYRVSEFFSF